MTTHDRQVTKSLLDLLHVRFTSERRLWRASKSSPGIQLVEHVAIETASTELEARPAGQSEHTVAVEVFEYRPPPHELQEAAPSPDQLPVEGQQNTN